MTVAVDYEKLIEHLKDQLEETRADLRSANRSANDLDEMVEDLKEQIELSQPSLIHEALRELQSEFGFSLADEDVPYRATSTQHRMRINEAIRRAQ